MYVVSDKKVKQIDEEQGKESEDNDEALQKGQDKKNIEKEQFN